LSKNRHVFLARHGETEWNAAARIQGHTDVPLNATGRAQALALADRMRAERVASIATSDLSRARGTAEIVAEILGLDVGLVDPDLRERRFGEFEGLTRGECATRFPDDWARWVGDSWATPPGGETGAALLSRVVLAIDRVAERLTAPALVVTHGGVMRAILGEGAGAANAVPDQTAIPNGGVLRVRVAAGRVTDVAWL
jgi:probable phosphoglycerate mutase